MFVRTVNVETIECARLAKGGNKGLLCAKAGIIPASDTRLVAYRGAKTPLGPSGRGLCLSIRRARESSLCR